MSDDDRRVSGAVFSYLTPGLIRGFAPRPADDLFSLGAVTFEMLTGDRLFDGSTDFDVLESIRLWDPECLEPHRFQLGPLFPVVRLLLNVKVSDRPPDAMILRAGLRTVAVSSDFGNEARALADLFDEVVPTAKTATLERLLRRTGPFAHVETSAVLAGVCNALSSLHRDNKAFSTTLSRSVTKQFPICPRAVVVRRTNDNSLCRVGLRRSEG